MSVLSQFLLQVDTTAIANTTGFELLDKLSTKFFIRLGIDLATVTILVRYIYFKIYKKSDQFLTFFAFNLVIFLLTYMLNKVELSMGAAFGLFAVFSMLRYRTENISTKEMTYLFLVIALGLLTAIGKGSWDELIFINGIVLTVVFVLESNWLFKAERSKNIIYEKAHLIHPNQREDMLLDLKERTGLNIHRLQINDIDFIKDAVSITVYYYD